MGGKGSGGRRSGAGRPRKDAVSRALGGRSSHSARVLAHPSAPAIPNPIDVPMLDEADAPDDLAMEERRIWLQLFPLAVSVGALKPDAKQDPGFKILCKNIVLERAQRLTEAGSSNHRGIQQAIRADMLAYGLRPSVKPQPVVHEQESDNPIKAKYFGNGR